MVGAPEAPPRFLSPPPRTVRVRPRPLWNVALAGMPFLLSALALGWFVASDREFRSGAAFLCLFFLLLPLALVVLLFLPRIRRERHLARNGEEALATVLSQTGSPPSARVFGATVENRGGRLYGGFRTDYVFRTTDGRELRGVLDRGRERMQPGSTFSILYDPSRPERNVATVAM